MLIDPSELSETNTATVRNLYYVNPSILNKSLISMVVRIMIMVPLYVPTYFIEIHPRCFS
jgi:hypothetical protein